MTFELPELPYSFDALSPHIDAETMEIHHDKHHAGYTDKLNSALQKYPDLQSRSIEDLLRDLDSLPEDIRKDVRNNGGGYANHSLFWSVMTPHETQYDQSLEKALSEVFGDVDTFKEKFSNLALSHFGSGWAWLTLEKGILHICSTPNQDTPLMSGNTPLLGLDVWEHAYYLAYQNRRTDYIKAWWNIVDWAKVSDLYKAASTKSN